MAVSMTPKRQIASAGAGVAGGLVGAAVMAMWAMLIASADGMGFWRPVQLIAAAWLGPAAMMHVSAVVIVAGLMTHMLMGAILGAGLQLLFQSLRIAAGWVRLGWGMMYGVAVWAVSQYVLLPVLDPAMAIHMPAGAFVVGHVMFGAVTAAFLLRRGTRQGA